MTFAYRQQRRGSDVRFLPLVPEEEVVLPVESRWRGWLAIVEDRLIQGYVSSSVVRPATGYGDGDCRLVEQTIREPGLSPVRERFNACRENDGGWRLSAA